MMQSKLVLWQRPTTKQKMATIKETATAYVPPQTKNIAELPIVSVELDVNVVEYTKDDGTTFAVNEVVIDGEKYRVPTSVLTELKLLLEKYPDMQSFSVTKTGTGLNTQYKVFKE